MRYIYPSLHPVTKRRLHPLILVATLALIIFSLAATASVLGFQPLAKNQAVGVMECHRQLIGNHADGDASVSGSGSDFGVSIPSLNLHTSDDAFKAPIVRA